MPIRREVAVAVAPPSREQIGGMLLKSSGMLLKRMTLGEKFTAGGSLAAIVGFFLPWGSVPDLRGFDPRGIFNVGGPISASTMNPSGFDIARLWGGFYLVLLGAVTAGVLFFIVGKSRDSKKLTISAFQILIGSLVGPQMLFAVVFTPMAQQVAGFGLWLTGLGYSAIAAGGIISVVQIARRA
jgi:hypothetical protein